MSWWDPFGVTDPITDMFKGPDYGDPNDYLNQMKPMLEEYYNPYIERGQAAGNTLDEKYAALLNDPAAMQQFLGQGYQQSPGYQYQLDEALNAATMSAAAGGKLGTTAHQNEAMKIATGEANKDYWNYYNQNANLFNTGLSGTQGMYNTGYNATNQMTQGLGNLYGTQANLAYTGNQNQNQMLSSLLGAGIGAAGYALGGPAGGLVGTQAAQGLTGGGSNNWKPANTGYAYG